MAAQLKHWLIFILLAIIWGASFYWQKLALREIGPFMVVGFRFLIAFVILVVLMRAQHLEFPRRPRTWLHFTALSFAYSTMPVLLAAVAGTRIDTGFASVLNASSPLFAIVFATVVFRDEALTWPKLLGTLIGFSGMLVIVSDDLAHPTGSNDMIGVLAQVLATAAYGFTPVLARRMLEHEHPIVQSAALVGLADVMIWVATPFAEPLLMPVQPLTWIGLLWLGALSSAAANVFYFTLLKAWGATRSTLVSYATPLVGLAIGALVLREPVTWVLLAGAVLVIIGIVVANRQTIRAT